MIGPVEMGLKVTALRCLLVVTLLLPCCWSDTKKAKSGGFTITFEKDGDQLPTITVLRDDGNAPVWFSSPTASFIRAVKMKQWVFQHGGDFIISSTLQEECFNATYDNFSVRGNPPNSVIIITGHLCESQFGISFQAITTGEIEHLQLNVTLSSTVYNQLWLTYGCEEDEGFFGFGAQYTYLNMKNRRLPLFLSEQGIGRGLEPITMLLDKASPGAGGSWSTTYTRVPFYISSYMRSLAVESLDYLVFDMTTPTLVTMEINSTSFIGRIITGHSPLELVKSYTAYSGRLQQLPEWIGEGAILGLQGGTDVVKDALKQVEEEAGSLEDIAAVWLQDWSGQRNFTSPGDLPRVGIWWNWEVDQQHYPNWEELISSLHSKGVKVLTYINPLLTNVSLRGTPYNHNYYDEGMKEDYFIRQGDGRVWSGYSNSSLTDINNPDAYNWLMNIIVENMIRTGVSGWMCDFGESVPLDARGEDPVNYHSLYPSKWAQLNSDAIRTAVSNGYITDEEANDIVYFMRSGNTHSPALTRLFWLGDQMVTWDSHDGLGTAIIGMLSSGMSGYSLTHSDIGGYTSIHVSLLKYLRSKELFLRWCELAAFTVTFRTHLGTLPIQNWQYNSDKETLTHFLRMTRVFKAWGFYRTELMKEASENGWPVVRHMLLAFPANHLVYKEDLRYQFMLGSELLVAPVYSHSWHKTQSVRVFLPSETSWTHVWSNRTYPGMNNWVTITAPVGYPCVLYPTGSSVGEQFVSNLNKTVGLPTA